MAVRVSVILERKGKAVTTVAPDTPVERAAAVMAENDVGALVVSADGRAVEGVVSERDLVRRLATAGAACLQWPVADVMTADVTTCTPTTTVDELMATMTRQRIRHVPVLVDGALGGIVSIGDVVKSRLDELEVHAGALEEYVLGSRG